MSDILGLALVIAVAAAAIVTLIKFSAPRNKPQRSIDHLNELHVRRVRVLEANDEIFQIEECMACEERWPCTTIDVLNWIEEEVE